MQYIGQAGMSKKYYSHCEGSALIGFMDRPGKYPVKSAERIRSELQAILDGGGDRVQVCSMNDVLENEEISRIFKKFFKASPQCKRHD